MCFDCEEGIRGRSLVQMIPLRPLQETRQDIAEVVVDTVEGPRWVVEEVAAKGVDDELSEIKDLKRGKDLETAHCLQQSHQTLHQFALVNPLSDVCRLAG